MNNICFQKTPQFEYWRRRFQIGRLACRPLWILIGSRRVLVASEAPREEWDPKGEMVCQAHREPKVAQGRRVNQEGVVCQVPLGCLEKLEIVVRGARWVFQGHRGK
ncbi:UNVERIFIED_CONTAM: hypothetical protein K2H54_047285, partial [Gekko kuhli]